MKVLLLRVRLLLCRFQKDAERRAAWIAAAGRTSKDGAVWQPSDNLRFSSCHLTEDMFIVLFIQYAL